MTSKRDSQSRPFNFPFQSRSWSQYAHQDRERIRSEIPCGRFGKTDEVAAACVFLCAETGAFVSGQAIHLNGGHYMF